jgi:hypothetical protein
MPCTQALRENPSKPVGAGETMNTIWTLGSVLRRHHRHGPISAGRRTRRFPPPSCPGRCPPSAPSPSGNPSPSVPAPAGCGSSEAGTRPEAGVDPLRGRRGLGPGFRRHPRSGAGQRGGLDRGGGRTPPADRVNEKPSSEKNSVAQKVMAPGDPTIWCYRKHWPISRNFQCCGVSPHVPRAVRCVGRCDRSVQHREPDCIRCCGPTRA